MLIYKDVANKTTFAINTEEAGLIIYALEQTFCSGDSDCFECMFSYDEESSRCIECLERTRKDYRISRDIIYVLKREVFS